MTKRRDVLAGLAAGAAAIPAVAMAVASEPAVPGPASDPGTGPNAHYFPNVVLRTHEDQAVRFYDDLLRGRTVMINFMSVVHEQVYPVAGNLARVQELLADRLGRDVFMYSITVTPELDTPKILNAFAARFGAKPGWRFLTGERANIEVVRDRLFAQSFAPAPGCAPTHDCSMGLIRYGNESVGLWGAVPTRTEPEWIVERLSWIQQRQRPTGAPVRRGPQPSTYMS